VVQHFSVFRFKNLLRQIKKDLSDQGRRSLQINEWPEPAKQLLTDSFFWKSKIITSENRECARINANENIGVDSRLRLFAEKACGRRQSFHFC
jgi:hypothetical protein